MNFGSLPEWLIALFTCGGTIYAYGKISARLENVIADVELHRVKFDDHDMRLRTHGEDIKVAQSQILELQRERP